jgi:hypothetical protein
MKLALLIVAACGKSQPAAPPPDPGTMINQMTDFAERCDACKTDHACMRPLRDEFDGVKQSLVYYGQRLTGDDRTKFDAALMHLRACGDGGGLTFWVDP